MDKRIMDGIREFYKNVKGQHFDKDMVMPSSDHQEFNEDFLHVYNHLHHRSNEFHL